MPLPISDLPHIDAHPSPGVAVEIAETHPWLAALTRYLLQDDCFLGTVALLRAEVHAVGGGPALSDGEAMRLLIKHRQDLRRAHWRVVFLADDDGIELVGIADCRSYADEPGEAYSQLLFPFMD